MTYIVPPLNIVNQYEGTHGNNHIIVGLAGRRCQIYFALGLRKRILFIKKDGGSGGGDMELEAGARGDSLGV